MVTPPAANLRPSIYRVRSELSRVWTLSATGHYAAALELAQTTRIAAEALAWLPLISAVRHSEALALSRTGAYAESEASARQAYLEASRSGSWDIAVRQSVHGESHPSTATSYNNLGIYHFNIGDDDQALVYHRKALAIREEILDANHPRMASSKVAIAAVYRRTGKYEQAFEHLRSALAIRQEALGQDHAQTVQTRTKIQDLCENHNYEPACAAIPGTVAQR